MNISELKKHYNLQPHPEGGFFSETYRCEETFPAASLPDRFSGDRNFSTAIYFLLEKSDKSLFHKIESDEIWHFYLGGPLKIIELHHDGNVHEQIIGQDFLSGQKVQHVVPAGVWFGAFPIDGTDFSFVGCTVAPGFDFNDFKMAERSELLKKWPDAKKQILHLTK